MKEKNKFISIIIHAAFFLFILGALIILFLRFSNLINGGTLFSAEEIDANPVDTPDMDPLDWILPVVTTAENAPVDDGVTKIVAFGNNPLSDDRDSDTNLSKQIAALTGTTVYNCSIPGSFLSAYNESFSADSEPMDAFSFYWLTTAFCLDIYQNIDNALAAMPDADPDIRDSVALLKSIDFKEIDVIALMYDGSDYLAGREMYSDDNFTDIQQFTGSMAAGIELIQSTFPHIRIIVMSPAYAFGVEEDGSYVSSERKTYGQHYLSTYMIKQAEAAYQLRVSFVDNLYGTILEEDASEYLADHIHLNEKGRKLMAERFVYALNRFPDPVIE